MKFVVSNNEQPNVTFSVEVDDDGDLMLYANGHKLLFIACRGGRLARMSVPDDQRAALAGLSFSEGGLIEISI